MPADGAPEKSEVLFGGADLGPGVSKSVITVQDVRGGKIVVTRRFADNGKRKMSLNEINKQLERQPRGGR